MYDLEFSSRAKIDVQKLSNTPKYFKKLEKLLEEIVKHPTTGTGKPEQLKHYETPTWSRRISGRHRLVYQIHENTVTVLVIAAFGHYEDR
ncbi:MAG: Txe/YoeB family addiction module toxin [Dysgonamonadaceae bacterium]|jgi:toxin YoeB|nr:Txe/YoeB family addiction module toxin [Dysgonamonadaceae bacterium]